MIKVNNNTYENDKDIANSLNKYFIESIREMTSESHFLRLSTTHYTNENI